MVSILRIFFVGATQVLLLRGNHKADNEFPAPAWRNVAALRARVVSVLCDASAKGAPPREAFKIAVAMTVRAFKSVFVTS